MMDMRWYLAHDEAPNLVDSRLLSNLKMQTTFTIKKFQSLFKA